MFKFLAKKLADTKVLTDIDSVIKKSNTFEEVANYLKLHPKIIEDVWDELWYLLDGPTNNIRTSYLERFATLTLCLPTTAMVNDSNFPHVAIVQLMRYFIVLEEKSYLTIGGVASHLHNAYESYFRFLSAQTSETITEVFNHSKAAYVRKFVRGFYGGWTYFDYDDVSACRGKFFTIDYSEYDRIFANIIAGVKDASIVRDILEYAVFPMYRFANEGRELSFEPLRPEDHIDLYKYPIPAKCFKAITEYYPPRMVADLINLYVKIIWRSHERQPEFGRQDRCFSPLKHLIPDLDWETEKRILVSLHTKLSHLLERNDWERVYSWAGDRERRIDLMLYALDLFSHDMEKRSNILIDSCFMEMLLANDPNPDIVVYFGDNIHQPRLYLMSDIIIAFVKKVGYKTAKYTFTKKWYWFGEIKGSSRNANWFENYLFLDFLARKVCSAQRRVRRIAMLDQNQAIDSMMEWYSSWLLKHPEAPSRLLKEHAKR